MKTKLTFIVPVVILFFLLSSFSFFNSSEKVTIKRPKKVIKISPKNDKIVFWYSVRVKIEDRQKIYQIIGAGGSIKKGELEIFEKELWKSIAKRQILIGPFFTQQEALNSRLLYKREEKKITKRPNITEDIYWFAVKFHESERMKVYIFERTMASVQDGSVQQFIDALYVQLGFQQFSIGPFIDYQSAEDAKTLYRKNE